MQIFVLALVLGIFLHDSLNAPGIEAGQELTFWLLGVSLLPKVMVALLYYSHCRLVLRRLGTSKSQRLLKQLGYTSTAYRWLVLMLYAHDLARTTPLSMLGIAPDQSTDVLAAIRNSIDSLFGGQLILVDELLIMFPPLAMMIFAWWAYYPIERRLRQAALMSFADEGKPIYPIWGRGQYIVSQVRHQLALILVPMLPLLALLDVLRFSFVQRWLMPLRGTLPLEETILLVGAGGVFLLAPLMIRWVWDTQPLPEGELRQMLRDMCKRHHIAVRELLLWRTYGGMINAAVMGVIAPLRYILLTDALLDSMPRRHVEAVMAHEIAHVRKHHMFWLILAAMALIEIPSNLLYVALARSSQWLKLAPEDEYLHMAGAIVAVVIWFLAFGWVSRRFERQADTFAVQHLTRNPLAMLPPSAKGHPQQDSEQDTSPPSAEHDGEMHTADPSHAAPPTVVSFEAVSAMIGALEEVAVLNYVPTQRKSWRHGSIAWRQNYLRKLIGQPLDRLSIDTTVRRINIASAAAMLGLITLYTLSQIFIAG